MEDTPLDCDQRHMGAGRNDLNLYCAKCDQIRLFVHGILSACRAGDGLHRSSPRNGRRGTGVLFANGRPVRWCANVGVTFLLHEDSTRRSSGLKDYR